MNSLSFNHKIKSSSLPALFLLNKVEWFKNWVVMSDSGQMNVPEQNCLRHVHKRQTDRSEIRAEWAADVFICLLTPTSRWEDLKSQQNFAQAWIFYAVYTSTTVPQFTFHEQKNLCQSKKSVTASNCHLLNLTLNNTVCVCVCVFPGRVHSRV